MESEATTAEYEEIDQLEKQRNISGDFIFINYIIFFNFTKYVMFTSKIVNSTMQKKIKFKMIIFLFLEESGSKKRKIDDKSNTGTVSNYSCRHMGVLENNPTCGMCRLVSFS